MVKETILVVDDESSIRGYVRNILRIEGFQLLEAVDGMDALEQVERRAATIDLLVTDVRMPRMDGIALAHSLIELFPGTTVLYMSGYTDNAIASSGVLTREHAFLQKPFTPLALADKVRETLENENFTRQVGGE